MQDSSPSFFDNTDDANNFRNSKHEAPPVPTIILSAFN